MVDLLHGSEGAASPGTDGIVVQLVEDEVVGLEVVVEVEVVVVVVVEVQVPVACLDNSP